MFFWGKNCVFSEKYVFSEIIGCVKGDEDFVKLTPNLAGRFLTVYTKTLLLHNCSH